MPQEPDSTPTLARLLIELNPEAPAHLLARHVPDDHGCCRGCALPQAGPSRWPCTLHAAATAAQAAMQEAGGDRTRRP